MDSLQEQLKSIGLADTIAGPRERAFMQQLRSEPTPVPRYLFRVFTPRSDGSTDEEWVKSRDFIDGLPTATTHVFESTKLEKTAKRIDGHLRWKLLEKDNLMSWTSSLLFAIQYMFYRHADIRDRSSYKHIKLLVVDTSSLPNGSFIPDMDLINAFSRYDDDLADLKRLRESEYYFGEYLSQGSLHIGTNSVIVSAWDMFDRGLLKLRQEFQQSYNTPKREWANKVVKIREAYTSSDDLQAPVLEIEDACRVGSLFGTRFRLPVAIQLTAICKGRLTDGNVQAIFGRLNFTDSEREACAKGSSRMMETEKLPELQRARLTADIVCASYYLEKLKASLEEAEVSVHQAHKLSESSGDLLGKLHQQSIYRAIERVKQVSVLSMELENALVQRIEVFQS